MSILLQIEIGLPRRSNVSPPRPTKLLLEETAKMILQDTTNSSNNNNNRRRKKKRASERGVKTFHGKYPEREEEGLPVEGQPPAWQ